MKQYGRSLLALLAAAIMLAGVGCVGPWADEAGDEEFGYSPAYEDETLEDEEMMDREGIQENLDPYGDEDELIDEQAEEKDKF